MSKSKPTRRVTGKAYRELCPVCHETTRFYVDVKPGHSTAHPDVRADVSCDSCNTPLVPCLPLVKMTDSGYVLEVSREARDVLVAFYGLQRWNAGTGASVDVDELWSSVEAAVTDVANQLCDNEPDWSDIAIVASGIESEACEVAEKAREMDSLKDKVEAWRDMFVSAGTERGV